MNHDAQARSLSAFCIALALPFSFSLTGSGGGVTGRGTTTGARREGGGEINPVWPRRKRWGAGGGDEDGERVRERALADARLVTTLWAGLPLLGPGAFDEPAASSPIQNNYSARAWLNSSAIASRVIVFLLL